ncbi:hypothetical protein D6Z83_23015 [Pseudoroseomonas wenyumeiae]|uniref:Common-antigen outer membrane protein n=2 Tax=Teichococcus wenyumeiae TaxID=2478470 RepID=A0A3A9J7A0_9PROT|nr:hypothetical protein D6Z83_23015 [Pseudoroseomonas wenyumeiae]
MGVNGFPLATQSPAAARMLPRLRLPAVLGLVLLSLSGCSMVSSRASAPSDMASPPIGDLPPRPADPLAAFAARAQLGQEELVGSPPVPVRLMRAYNSGGGRPCRQLLLGSMATGRQALYCETMPGQWDAVRPLLQNGPPIRP